VHGTEDALKQRIEDARVQPTDDDRRWPLSPPEVIGEHLSVGDSRPELSCALVVGRAYSLTPGQRDYVRERFNMTPAPLVRVTEVALYPGTQLIRRVTLVSEVPAEPSLGLQFDGRLEASNLAIAMVAVLGPSLVNVVLALSLIGWVGYARLVRGQVLRAREFELIFVFIVP